MTYSQELEASRVLRPFSALFCSAVRFDWDQSLLKVYSGSSGEWLPVCSSSWNDTDSKRTCQQLGFDR